MDIWVQNSQFWMNSTYANVEGFIPAPTDGITGWDTMFALTRALQHELGITSLSDNFGPTTLSRLTNNVGSVGAMTANTNIVAIMQCAMWCKGYWGGTDFGTFTSEVGADIGSMRANMGLSTGATVTPKMFKSLLTMDAYTLIGNGTPEVRAIQQWLNSKYLSRADFFLVPCDGNFSRDVQRGLMLAIQYEIGMPDGTANGNFGPGTKQGIRDQAHLVVGSTDSGKAFVRLFQAALTFNSYATAFDGVFSSQTRTTTQQFQSFAALTANGEADFQTWASLLVSTGDVDRPGRAADCITTINTVRAQTLTSSGYEIVGRYLTNYPGPNPTNKKIQPGELQTIFANGLRVFPIFQQGGDAVEYFSEDQGYESGLTAYAAALSYGFLPGTTIYFAVDFDAVEEEAWAMVVPYFQGVNNALFDAGGEYSAGIYSARNTCSIVSGEGLAQLSFVSDMSTGYSGNLGFTLPTNWAFDQILEYSIGSGSGAINIDKSVTSGRDQGQSTLRSPSTFATYIQWLYNHALAYKDTHPGTTYSANDLVLQYLRQPTYAGVNWENAAGPILTFWVEYIDQQPTQRIFGFVSPRTGRYIHVSHFAAALHGMIHQNGWPADEGTVGIGDMTGWAGDLVQSFGDWIVAKRADPSLSDSYAFGRTWIARKGGHSDHDFDEDVDAAIIAAASLANPSAPVSDVINASYAQPDDYGAWYTRFLQTRFGGSTTTAYDAALDTFDSLDPGVVAYREGVLGSYLGVQPRPWEFTPADLANLAQAWTDILSAKIAGTE